ncbi:MAG: hypothetical protein E6J90_11485 [Deltaproteobacteria bacterium]|nr:MAG: hypothetical protein E6J90_11485 [Deltaproteobacteria bacterium]
MVSDNVWHQVHAQREDGVAAMFLIRDVEPRADQPKIFVVELPYPVTDLSGQPDAAAYRRLGAFQEQWLEPACAALGWTFVAWKCEDGSFFLYLYGAGDPEALLEKLAPFDGELGFYNDLDAEWSEYAALRELVEQAESAAEYADYDGHIHGADRGHAHGDSGMHGGETVHGGIRVIDLTGGATSSADLPTVVGHNGKSRSMAAAAETAARARSTRPARKAAKRASQPAPARASATPRAPASAAPAPRRASAAPAKRASVARKPSKRAAAATGKRAPAATARRTSTRRAPRR